MTDRLTGSYLRAWAQASLDGLLRHRVEINRLNVFPIPDSDTGTNMVATMQCAVDRLKVLDSGDGGGSGGTVGTAGAADVAAALAAGAVAGARGNSGMVLSQILRAIADSAAMSATGDLSARAIPVMLTRAGELVTEALSDPVEGTIVTVLRAAADGAGAAVAADRDADLDTVVTAARDAAVDALEQTTGQLAALSDAGVVDAGGRGFVVILQALVDALSGTPVDSGVTGHPDFSHGTGTDPHLELVFGFQGDADRLRTLLGDLGDSVAIVGDGTGSHRAHVHSVRSGELLEAVFSLGAVTGLRIEVLPAVPKTPQTRTASPVIALVPAGADGLATLFRRAGAAVGDNAATLAAALADLTDPAVAPGVDGQGVVLTNGQATTDLLAQLDQSRSAQVTVVDTASFVGGLAALAVYRPGVDIDDAAEDMADAVHGQRWTDVDCGGSEVIAGVADRIISLLDDGGELVTVLYGDELDDAGMAEVTARTVASHPETEIHGVHVPGLPVTAQVGVE
ncbi:DAK2 domain-containing protein [Corynebacterium terpenotabidum]|uniref:DhaL domain-containing protein n=1 Tax=Corynebacterium terpenotabidum Y-11 TaxID=1200352 RepID=S4XD33_9CORY|nr:DAK2 domain-containing protein [Corynebacterium terpenotabidum]AGP31052.1 hypothetical protein A606_07025 [Corynebacterium terpenotabidum Y-11]